LGYRYGHPATALTGILNYIQNKYPSSYIIDSLKENVPKDQRHAVMSLKGLNKFMQEYRSSRGSNPSNNLDRNAKYIQKDFKPFAEYCKEKLGYGKNNN